MYYGKTLFATWNLIAYNVLGQGGDGHGSDLYGVEPFSYYVKNLVLNFNVVVVLFVLSLAVRASAPMPRCSHRLCGRGAGTPCGVSLFAVY